MHLHVYIDKYNLIDNSIGPIIVLILTFSTLYVKSRISKGLFRNKLIDDWNRLPVEIQSITRLVFLNAD